MMNKEVLSIVREFGLEYNPYRQVLEVKQAMLCVRMNIYIDKTIKRNE